jgi:hypothetical protein
MFTGGGGAGYSIALFLCLASILTAAKKTPAKSASIDLPGATFNRSILGKNNGFRLYLRF